MMDIKQMEPNHRSTTIISNITFLFSVCAIAIIGLLIFSEKESVDSFWSRGEFFWFKLIWCEVVFCASWFFGLQIPFINLLGQRQQTGGAIPAISSAIIGACIWSYIILLGSVFLPNERQYNILPIVAQIIVIVICLWKVMILNQARHLQTDGITPISTDTKQPETLAAQLSISEKAIALNDALLAKRIKTVREKLSYSLPRVGKIATSSRYISLVQRIDLFCNIVDAEFDTKDISLELEKIEKELMFLVAELR